MLVIARRVGEVLWVGDARIVVTKIRGKSVGIGVDAPRDVPIVRDELLGDAGPHPPAPETVLAVSDEELLTAFESIREFAPGPPETVQRG